MPRLHSSDCLLTDNHRAPVDQGGPATSDLLGRVIEEGRRSFINPEGDLAAKIGITAAVLLCCQLRRSHGHRLPFSRHSMRPSTALENTNAGNSYSDMAWSSMDKPLILQRKQR